MEPIITPGDVQKAATNPQVAPIASATVQAPGRRSRSMGQNFVWLVFGGLLAVGILWLVPQLRRADAPGSDQGARVSELTPPPPTGSETVPVHTVSLNAAQHTQISLTPVTA